jgi:LmbE family N-acetylglucosaminyl deacetylase
MARSLRLMAIGAHPDDAEYKAGGLSALYRRLGHEVLLLSMTDGSSGHHTTHGPELACRRAGEARRAAELIGARAEVWDYPDGRLEASVEARERLIRAIRAFRPDLILAHRPCDYHADHRASGLLVQDAAYLLGVPAVCPDVPILRRLPPIAYYSDEFRRPYPFEADVVVDVGEVWDLKVAMLDAHESQFYEWLPYNQGIADEVPAEPTARRAWLSGCMEQLSRRLADRVRERLIAMYGPSFGQVVHLVEGFEVSEFGGPLDGDGLHRLFPMTPVRSPATWRE